MYSKKYKLYVTLENVLAPRILNFFNGLKWNTGVETFSVTSKFNFKLSVSFSPSSCSISWDIVNVCSKLLSESKDSPLSAALELEYSIKIHLLILRKIVCYSTNYN